EAERTGIAMPTTHGRKLLACGVRTGFDTWLSFLRPGDCTEHRRDLMHGPVSPRRPSALAFSRQTQAVPRSRGAACSGGTQEGLRLLTRRSGSGQRRGREVVRAALERLDALREEAQAAGKARFAKLTLTRAGCAKPEPESEPLTYRPWSWRELTHFPRSPPKTLRLEGWSARRSQQPPRAATFSSKDQPPPHPPPKKPHPGERRTLAARLTWGPGGWARDAGRRSLEQGERSGVSPGPCPRPIHKSAAAASGPRGIRSRRSPRLAAAAE
ncbi:unnamed protein product, partial [Rangifer tarandus platyrhynchus]